MFVALGGPAQAETVARAASRAITGADIKNESITSADIKNGTITSADVKDGAITGADVKDSSLTGADLADGSVGSAGIANGGVGTSDLANGAVTSSKLGVTPAFGAARATDVLVPNATFGLVGLTETFDATNAVTVTSGVIAVPVSGTYVVVGSASWEGCGAGDRNVGIILEGAGISVDTRDAALGSNTVQSTTFIGRLSAGQEIGLAVGQTSGASCDLLANGTSLSATWISP